MEHCNRHVGEAYFRTPRNTIKAFVQFLAILEQNPGTEWHCLVGKVDVSADVEDPAIEEAGGESGDEDLASIRL